ncbi:MAG: Poly-beta-hydroxybutyrate polymerase [Pseudomonadota bacterium]|jgi:polyhydroxyalkanoate synthase
MTQMPDFQAMFQGLMANNPMANMMQMPQMPQMPDLASLMPKGTLPGAVQFDSVKLQEIQGNYLKEAAELWNKGLQSSLEIKDRRFSGDAWSKSPAAVFTAATYLLNARTLMAMADAVQADEKSKARIRFAVSQWIDAASPANSLALNPDAQKKAIETKGESIAKGVKNLVDDIRKGHMSMTDESLFEVGKNMAVTQGAVVFQNEYFQLIEYKPTTKQVHEKPFLLVPPCINKFYILDLQPENSFIKYAVDSGFRTFVVSWRNPGEDQKCTSWDDYIEGAAITAIKKVQELTGAKKTAGINALGFCVGGTILTNALAVLADRGEKPVASFTLLTTLIDFTNTGILDVFIDENFVKYREMQMGKGGLLKGQELASTFSFLRPNDLVWNYVVGNYLKGETPPPFDLLYWNSDSTNLPGPMYAWYLRNTYLENNLIKPSKTKVCGNKIDLTKVDMPVYLYASREDHIVPIEGAYASTQVFPGKKRMVMGASGHIAGVINPAKSGKRCYWINEKGNDKPPKKYEDWFAGSKEVAGSWWPDWSDWLKGNSGKLVPAPKTYAAKAMEPAPGSYVKAKA